MVDDEAVAEDAIRRYLHWLSDPSSIIDTAAIDAAEQQARQTTDVIDKLKALSRVEHLRAGDTAAVKAAFLAHAKVWGDANEISAASWIRLGVPPEVLREAGVTGNRATRPGTSTAPAPRAPRVAGSSASSVSSKQIATFVLALADPFVLTDVAEGAGGSPMTIRKAVDQLVADGLVTRLGPDPRHDGRGRAPIRYQTRS